MINPMSNCPLNHLRCPSCSWNITRFMPLLIVCDPILTSLYSTNVSWSSFVTYHWYINIIYNVKWALISSLGRAFCCAQINLRTRPPFYVNTSVYTLLPITQKVFDSAYVCHFRYLKLLILKVAKLTLFLYYAMMRETKETEIKKSLLT